MSPVSAVEILLAYQNVHGDPRKAFSVIQKINRKTNKTDFLDHDNTESRFCEVFFVFCIQNNTPQIVAISKLHYFSIADKSNSKVAVTSGRSLISIPFRHSGRKEIFNAAALQILTDRSLPPS